MLQQNLIYGIQEKIKRNSLGHKEVLEESTLVEPSEKETELVLESSFASAIYEKAEKAKQKEEIQKTLITESFTMRKAEKKLTKDIVYFNYLYENYVADIFKDQYKELVESIFEDTIKLYQECDVTPRLLTPAVDSNELTEATIEDIYKNNLNESIKEKYTKPLLSGTISELYESEIRTLTKKLIEEGVQVDLEQVRVYMPFEEAVYQFNRSVLIPSIAEKPIQSFMESMTEEYKEFLEETAEDILQRLEKKIRLLTSMIAPEMFNKAVEAEGVDAPKMAGVTIVVDKNFDGDQDCDDGVCPDEVVATDPEAAEELADDEEAEDIDKATEDLVGAEEEAREELELANEPEDYETEEADEEAEESPVEQSLENGEEEPGAIELDLSLENPNPDDDNAPSNDSDVALSGDGEEVGELSTEPAELPGDKATPGAETEPGVDIEVDADETPEEALENKEDVSEEIPDEEETEELEKEEKKDLSEDKK